MEVSRGFLLMARLGHRPHGDNAMPMGWGICAIASGCSLMWCGATICSCRISMGVNNWLITVDLSD
jgi:hypothetical protein